MIKELNYDITKDDLKNYANDCLSVKQFKKGRLVTTVIFFALTSVFILLALLLNKGNTEFVDVIIPFIVISVFSLIFHFFYYPILFQKSVLKLNKDTNFLKNNVTIDSENDVLLSLDDDNRTEYKWSKIKEVYNLKYSILIFISDSMSIIIPKRIFETEQEINETWNLILDCYNKMREEN